MKRVNVYYCSKLEDYHLGADTQKFVQWKIEEFTITDQTKSINQDSSNVS